MRPFQIIFISVFAVSALVGLYLFSTYKGFGGGKPLGQVTVWGTLPATSITHALDTLKSTHQEFGKVTYVERSAATFDTDLANAIASGSGPDLIIITQEQLGAESSKISVISFNSIPERTFKDTNVPINEIYLTPTGTYAIPFLVDPLVLYYNRTLLSNAGIATPPTSWEAIVGLAPTLTKKSDTLSISKSTVALGTYENIPNARALISLLFLQSGSTITENGTQGVRGSLASNGSTAAYGLSPSESALSFYTQFADPAKVVYSWNRSMPNARQAFIAGDTAFYVGFASEQKLLKSSNPNLDFDMASIPQPLSTMARTDYGLAYAFAIPKATKNSDGAYRTAVALSQKEEVMVASDVLGMAPAQRALLVPQTNDVFSPVYYPLALIAKGWLSPSPSVTDSIFAGMINDVISGRSSVRDALLNADQSLTAALSH